MIDIDGPIVDEPGQFTPDLLAEFQSLVEEGQQLLEAYVPLGRLHLHTVLELVDDIYGAHPDADQLRASIAQLMEDIEHGESPAEDEWPAGNEADTDSKSHEAFNGDISDMRMPHILRALSRVGYEVRLGKGRHVVITGHGTSTTIALSEIQSGKVPAFRVRSTARVLGAAAFLALRRF